MTAKVMGMQMFVHAGLNHTVKKHCGRNTPRSMQVAEAAENRGSSTQAAGQHEAALYAALAGHFQKILPVCQNRADVLWAYARSWLALQVDQQLSEDQGQDSSLQSALQLGQDSVKAVQRADPEEVRKVVLDDVTSCWPPDRSAACRSP